MLRLIAGLLLAIPLTVSVIVGSPPRRGGTYEIHERGTYGPVWGNRLPPGLPRSARPCSAPGAAIPWIRAAVAREGIDDPVFLATVLHLAETESGAMFGRPANNYDNRPESARPAGQGPITAWGCFQWNKGAGRNSGHMAKMGIPGLGYPSDWQPYQVTAWEEVAGPVRMYARLWRAAIEADASPTDAARLIRMWHRGSAWGRRMLELGRQSGDWRAAFDTTASAADRSVVDRHLRAAGVLTA